MKNCILDKSVVLTCEMLMGDYELYLCLVSYGALMTCDEFDEVWLMC